MWLLEELGAPYEFYQMDFSKGDNRSDYFLAINPAGKVPVLCDGDLAVSESGAMCQYLADQHARPQLIPSPGTPERAIHDQWLFFALTELEQPLWTAGKHRFAIPEAQRVPAIMPTAHWEFNRAAGILSAGLAGRNFIAGDQFSVADIFVAHTLRWAVAFEFSIDHPHLQDYLERMESRPARQNLHAKEALEIPRAG